ncbi:MAG: UPF0147 family protein [Candidatus Thermoplasmatota archaeon]|jgi:uncharacterized protein (UPF0147 family)|nr:UPF0147 family protein [Candidatus Thermoplasmatota archaeon]
MDEMTQILMDTSKMLDDLISDYSIPRNIRKNIQIAKQKLSQAKGTLDIRAATSISALDEIVNDPNTPGHARTLIYTIMGKLEIIQKKASSIH